MYVIDQDISPDGDPVELTYEDGYFTVWIAGESLMSSEMHGSERKMAELAAKHLRECNSPNVLIGGLGMGYTLRAALDHFGTDANIVVAELLPFIVRLHRGVLEPLAGAPLRDSRVTLFEGDVADAVPTRKWDTIMLDVDNGPQAFTVSTNADLYNEDGVRALYDALAPGGLLIVWSSHANREFVVFVKGLGLPIRAVKTATGGPEKKVKHTLFLLEKTANAESES